MMTINDEFMIKLFSYDKVTRCKNEINNFQFLSLDHQSWELLIIQPSHKLTPKWSISE